MQRRDLLKMLGFTSVVPYMGLTLQAQAKPVSTENSALAPDDYNLVVYGATPGGVALAVRAAREGLKVMLVNPTQHLGGMYANGLGTMDTLYNGSRSPIYDEYRYSIYDYYRTKYGKPSSQYKAALPGFAKTKYESHVAELLIDRMVNREPGITVMKGYYPGKANKTATSITSIEFFQLEGTAKTTVGGAIFADCSYEGDLLVLAGVKHRIGRESKQEYGESHAGISYTKINSWPPSAEHLEKESFKMARRMNVEQYDQWSDLIMPQSTGAADRNVQAFNIRTTLTNDPGNRIIPDKPKNYDPEYIKKRYKDISGTGLKVPNMKTSWNQPELIGEQNKYVEGTWAERKAVMQRFRDDTLAVLYFKQNDPSEPEESKKMWKEWGLPKNEYVDNGNMPYELYVREARRIEGTSVFTQHDGSLAPGLKRAPVHEDSISVTEWFMDSHACTEHELEGSKPEGEVMLKNLTFPGQISFNTIFPKDLDNFIVPVCLSTSHIGWGTIRLEPTWMSICEAAGYIVALSATQNIKPAKVDKEELLRTLADKGVMLSFFNDVEGREYETWYPAVQYMGTKGYFGTYEVMAEEKLNSELADAWLLHTTQLLKNTKLDHTAVARTMMAAEQPGKSTLTAEAFAKKLSDALPSGSEQSKRPATLLKKFGITPKTAISRGDACWLIYESTRKA